MKWLKPNTTKHGKKSSIYKQWLISYALVLILPIVFNIFFYMHSMNVVKSEIVRANMAVLERAGQMVDSRMREIKKFSLQLATNLTLVNAVTENPNLETSKLYIYEAMREMRQVAVYNSFVRQMYLLSNRYDRVITTNEQTGWESFYSMMHLIDDLSYDEWLNLLDDFMKPGYRTLYVKAADGNVIKTFAYFQMIPAYNTMDPAGLLVILIDESEFQKQLAGVEWLNNGASYIIDSNNEIRASSGTISNELALKYEELTNESQVVQSQIDGTQRTVMFTSSEETDWKYVLTMDGNVFWENANQVRDVFLVLTLLVVTAGFILSRYITRRNYGPMERILHLIENRDDNSSFKWNNEYEAISSYIKRLGKTGDELTEALNEQTAMLRDRFLSLILTAGEVKNVLEKNRPAEYGTPFESNQFGALVFKVEEFSEMFPDSEYYGEKTVNIVNFLIRNVFEEIGADKFVIYILQQNNMPVGIVNPKTEMSPHEYEKELDVAISNAREFFSVNLKIDFTVGVSALKTGLSEMPSAYAEAREALANRFVIGRNKTIFYPTISETQEASSYSYSIDEEQRFINCVTNANIKGAESILNKLFSEIEASTMNTMQMATCLKYDLASTIMKLFNLVNDNAFIEDVQPIKTIVSSETIQELKAEMRHITFLLVQHFEKDKTNFKMSERVEKYVTSNFNDPNLNVNELGNRFRMSPSYLSKIFKQETGERLPEYINKVRIDAAKEMLLHTRKSIGDIATRTGYNDSNAFITSFKKVEGITPGQYRANVEEEKCEQDP